MRPQWLDLRTHGSQEPLQPESPEDRAASKQKAGVWSKWRCVIFSFLPGARSFVVRAAAYGAQ